ncbi:MAG TPA: transglutaminase family protein, partial [Candidatus Udaeobacter sp.]|nr:transglutaminase family protein [Candidatus Udaeobacter sp.]
PRWAFTCFFRRDKGVIWKDPSLIGKTGTDYGHTVEHAERFMRRLVENLALKRNGLMPAYEDAWYYLWRERRLPENVDVLDSRLDDPLERLRLTKVFEQGLNTKVGWVLPLSYWNGWFSGDWFLRKEHCFLMPGDSPIGYRLPLDSQPWALPKDRDEVVTADTFAALPPLPPELRFPLHPANELVIREQRRWPNKDEVESAADQELFDITGRRHLDPDHGPLGPRHRAETNNTLAHPYVRPLPGESAGGITRTALCVEPRQGLLRVFMPPLPTASIYIELVNAVERTAADLKLPVQLEGYPPPWDPRIGEFKVTPDPGVIEVNIPPTTSWASSVQQTEQLYDAARHEELVAEKFEIDGTHVGSGGGNHLVLGGIMPEDSPFLRRPDVLGSLL